MEIRQLQYFISAAKHLNFTRAARECHIVQTAMTHQIAALEKELGTALFIRNNRTVSLTPIGEAFLKQAQRIVAHAQNALDMVETLRAGQNSTLNIGYCGNTLRPQWPELLRRFRAEQPDVRVMLRQGGIGALTDLLESGALDLVVSIHYDFLGLYGWMDERVLFTDKTMLILRKDHPFAARESARLGDIAELPMVVYTEKGSAEKFARCANEGHPLNVVAEMSETDCVKVLIEAGHYASICMSHMIDACNPYIKGIPIEDDAPSDVVALLDRRRINANLEAFVALLKKYDYQARRWTHPQQS